jgi:hypothetical protein
MASGNNMAEGKAVPAGGGYKRGRYVTAAQPEPRSATVAMTWGKAMPYLQVVWIQAWALSDGGTEALPSFGNCAIVSACV